MIFDKLYYYNKHIQTTFYVRLLLCLEILTYIVLSSIFVLTIADQKAFMSNIFIYLNFYNLFKNNIISQNLRVFIYSGFLFIFVYKIVMIILMNYTDSVVFKTKLNKNKTLLIVFKLFFFIILQDNI